MPVVVNRHLVPAAEADRWRRPRRDVLEEAEPEAGPDGALTFAMARGPFHEWRRRVVLDRPEADGRVPVTEEVDYRLAVPVWGPLFSAGLRGRLRRGADPTSGPPWWAPPQVLDARAATVLSLLCLLGAVAGYLGTLITQTVTFAARQFDATTTDQGTLLAAVRIGVLLSMLIVARADRSGRARILRFAVVGGCVVTALGALAPGMVWLGTTQTFARALSTVAALVIGIIAVEEMPAGSRAFAVSVLAMTAALGAGLCVMNVAYADVAEGAWRIAFVIPLLSVPLVWPLARRVPETQRFERHRLDVPVTGVIGGPDPSTLAEPALEAERELEEERHRQPTAHADPGTDTDPGADLDTRPAAPDPTPMPAPAGRGSSWRQLDRGRFALLAVSGFAWSLFIAPAAQFLNEYLRTERGFSSLTITLFVLLTNTPGGIGIVVGGRLADRRGRRLIGAIGILGGVGFTVASYLLWGWPLWATSVIAAVVGALAIPAMAVYGPELFPTNQRGLANGGLQVLSVAGSSVGLLAAGWLADRFGSLGPAMALLAVGPLVLVVLIATRYPETARRELEDLNPSDR